MANTPAKSKPSYTELADMYNRVKTREKKAKSAAKIEGERMVEDVLTLASAGGLSYIMGQKHAEGEEAAAKEGLTPNTQEFDEKADEAAQLAGIDIDVLAGGACTALGMMGLAGNMSGTVRKIGIGGLAAAASRIGYDKGGESVTEKDEEG